MLRSLPLILLGVSVFVMDDGSNTLLAQGAYPRVYGPTGRPYGPTQAHYQYERQYGRPWHGGPAQFDPNTGANIRVHGGWGGFPGYGYYGGFQPFGGYGYGLPGYYQGYYGQGYYGFAPIQPYVVTPQQVLPQFGSAPVFSWQQPDASQLQLMQPAPQGIGAAQPRVPQRAGDDVAINGPVGPPQPVMNRPHAFMPAPPSTAAQRQQSIHFQGQGDVWFRQQNYLQAYSRYKQAAGAAPDLAAPRFRMAYALMALRRFELAVPEFQRGIKLDPQYPLNGESPEQVYGEENRLAAAALPQAVAAWVRQDIRSPDRLFLLGALLVISGDQARAKTLLDTAAEFGGPAEHVVAFLRLTEQPVAATPRSNPREDQPPVPESVEKMLRENRDWLPARPLAKSQSVHPDAVQAKPNPEVTPIETVEPETKAVPAEAERSLPVPPGYVTIPKKGSAPKPVPKAEPSGPPPAAVPASPSEDAGPAFPAPPSGN